VITPQKKRTQYASLSGKKSTQQLIVIFINLVTDYLKHKRRELLKIIWETNNVYWDEIDKVRKTSPQFADVLHHLGLIS